MRLLPSGFTLLELLLVITVVLVLATIAITQTSGAQKALQFNNTFQQVVFLTQRARTMALTERTPGSQFGIDFAGSPQNEVRLFEEEPTSIEEEFTFPSGVYHEVTQTEAEAGAACLDTQISFDTATGETNFSCTGADEPLVLRVTLCQLTAGISCTSKRVELRRRSFLIHRAAGIPQF